MADGYEVKDAKGALLVHDEGNGYFEALVSITNVIDNGNDMILPGAYQQTIKQRQHPKLLAGHDWGRLTGKVLQMEEWFPNDPRLPPDLRNRGAGALWIKGRFNLKTAEGREAYERVKFLSEDDPLGCEWSIGYDCSPTADGARAAIRQDGVRLIKSLDLLECSDVVVGMVPHTRALMVKAYNAGAFNQLDPSRRYTIGELVGYTTKVYAQDTADESEGKTVAEYTPVSHEKDKQTQAGRQAVSNVTHPTPTGGPGYVDEDGVDAGEDIHAMPLPKVIPTARAGVDKTTQEGETSYTKARFTASEWARRLGMMLEGKDWAQWDADHPDRSEDEDEDGSSSSPSEPSAPKAPGEESQEQESAAQAPPKPPSPPSPPKPPSEEGESGEGEGEDEKNEEEGEKLGEEAGGLIEKISKIGEAVHEGIEEGREKGKEFAESFEHHGSKGGYDPFVNKSLGEVRLGSWSDLQVKAIDMPATDVDDEVQQNDPVVDDEDGNKSDMTHMVDAPEDAALKRGIPDEDTMQTDSAMKSWKGIPLIALESKDWAAFDAARAKVGNALRLSPKDGDEGHGWSKNGDTHTKTTSGGDKLTVKENPDGSADWTRHDSSGNLADYGHKASAYTPSSSPGLGDFDNDPLEEAKTDAEASARKGGSPVDDKIEASQHVGPNGDRSADYYSRLDNPPPERREKSYQPYDPSDFSGYDPFPFDRKAFR